MNIEKRLKTLHAQIHHVALTCKRDPDSVHILAVSKGQPVEKIKRAYEAGLTSFGESYLQEALPKIKALAKLPVSWHFIGAIQSNKAKEIANYFSWVHSVCRLKIARLLNDERPPELPPLNVCVQINFGEEKQKSGIDPEQAHELIAAILTLPRLRLRGLMMIPPQSAEENQQYLYFARLKELFNLLNSSLPVKLDTLSIGMSSDWPAAICAGSTMIRIGQAIFGERHS